MRLFFKLVSILLLGAASSAFADELFPDRATREIPKLALLPKGSTIGGYAIFNGDLSWKIISTEVTTNNSDTRFGGVQLIGPIANSYFAEMWLRTNLTQASENVYYTGDPCATSSPPLFKVNKSAGKLDNCLFIRPHQVSLGNRELTALFIKVRNTQSNSRLYDLGLLMDPSHLGFPNTTMADWTLDAVASDPRKKEFLGELAAWSEKLQDAVNLAIGFDKPQNAFDGVPAIGTLARRNAKTTVAAD